MELPLGSGPDSRSPQTALLLARAMENSEQPGPLSRALGEGGAGGLREAWDMLSASERREIRGRLGDGAVEEMLSLAAERDAAVLGESLISLGIRLENAERLEAAAGIFAVVVGAVRERPLQERARTRLDAILGRGAVLPRLEFLGRRLAAQASDPAMIAGMAGAGLAFRMTRLAALSRLSAGSGFFSRPLVARGLANAAGFGVESVAFTGSVRAANAALGRRQDWSARALWHEYAAGTLTLGALKLTGALARLGVSRIGPNPHPFGRFTQMALPQAALFGGILLSHDLEARLGLRPHVDGATSVTDALGTLLQFHVGGRLAREVSGPRLQGLEQELERRAAGLEAEGARAPRVAFQRPLRDYFPERVVTWARRLGRLGRGTAYAPLWTVMGVGFGGGFGGPPRRFVESRTLRVENVPVRVEIFHRSEIPRDTVHRIEQGLRRLFEEGEVPFDFDGQAEAMAGDIHYLLQRLRNGGPTLRARLEISALGTIERFEITEEGKRPYIFAPEPVESEAPAEIPSEISEVAGDGEPASIEAPREPAASEPEPLPSARPAAEIPTRLEFTAPELPQEGMDRVAEVPEVVEPSTAPPPAGYNPAATPVVPPGFRLRPPHRRLLGVSPGVQQFEIIPAPEHHADPFELGEARMGVAGEALVTNLSEEIRTAEPWEAGQEVFYFLIERFRECEEGDLSIPQFGEILLGVQDLLQRRKLMGHEIIPEPVVVDKDSRLDVGPNELLSTAYSGMVLRSWMRGRQRIFLGTLVRKLIRTWEGRDDRGIVDPTPRRWEGPRGGSNTPPAPAAPNEGFSTAASGVSILNSGGDSSGSRGTQAAAVPPAVSARPQAHWGEVRGRLGLLEAEIRRLTNLDPERAEAARGLNFQIRGLREAGVSSAGAMEVAQLLSEHLGRGTSLRNVERDFRAASRSRVLARLAEWLETGPEWGPVVRRAMNLFRELAPSRGWSLCRSVTALDVLEQVLQGDPARLSPQRWMELFDSFEARIRRDAPFAEVLVELRAVERRSRPDVSADPTPEVGASELASRTERRPTLLPPPPHVFAELEFTVPLMLPDGDGGYRRVSAEAFSTGIEPGRGLTALFSRPARSIEIIPLRATPEPAADEFEVLSGELSGLPRREAVTRVLNLLESRLSLTIGDPMAMVAQLRRQILRLPTDFLPSLRRIVREHRLGNEPFLSGESLNGIGLNRRERRILASQSRLRTLDQYLAFLEGMAPRPSSGGPAPSRRAPRVGRRTEGRNAAAGSRDGVSPTVAETRGEAEISSRFEEAEALRAREDAIPPIPPARDLGREAAIAGPQPSLPEAETSRLETAPPEAVERNSAPAEPASEVFNPSPEARVLAPTASQDLVAQAPSLVEAPAESLRPAEVEAPTEMPVEAPIVSGPEVRPTPPPVRPSPLPPRSLRLSALLAEGSGIPVSRIDGYLRANEMQRRLIVPPTLEEFAAARASLEARLPEAEASEAASIRAFLRSMDDALREPSAEELRAFNRAALPELDGTAARRFQDLSEQAQRGLYLLALALPAAQRGNLSSFLSSPEVARLSGGAEEVLRGVALLHDLGVRGYEQGFLPVPGNAKFLGTEENALQGANGEYLEALRTGADPAVDRVWMGTSLRIRWDRLPEEQRQIIEREIRPLFENRGYDYSRQQASEVDHVYRTIDGRRRLVEVKVSRRSNYAPGTEEIGKVVLQVFRHALLVRQHGMEGLEYRITAPSVNPRWISRLQDILNYTGVPWVLTVRETASGRTRVLENGMEALRGDGAISARPLRPIPALPGSAAVEASTNDAIEAQVRSEEPWSEAMIDFLNRGLEGQNRIPHRFNREESMARLIDQLRALQQRRLADSIQDFLMGPAVALPESRVRRLRELHTQIRITQGETMSRSRVGLFFEIAALATGERLTAEEAAAGGPQLRGLEQNLRNNPALWQTTLESWRRSLEAIEELSSQMSPEEIEAELAEYSADRIVDISSDVYGQNGMSLRQIGEAIETGRLSTSSNLADAIRESIELYDALRGGLRLREE